MKSIFNPAWLPRDFDDEILFSPAEYGIDVGIVAIHLDELRASDRAVDLSSS